MRLVGEGLGQKQGKGEGEGKGRRSSISSSSTQRRNRDYLFIAEAETVHKNLDEGVFTSVALLSDDATAKQGGRSKKFASLTVLVGGEGGKLERAGLSYDTEKKEPGDPELQRYRREFGPTPTAYDSPAKCWLAANR